MIVAVTKRDLREYQTSGENIPFREWLQSLDKWVRTVIRARLERLRNGNLGDSKSVGDGVFELRCDCGPGYRIYFANAAKEMVILLIGGSKGSQRRDIELAKKYWADYKSRSGL